MGIFRNDVVPIQPTETPIRLTAALLRLPAVTPMLDQGADDVARIVRADRERRPVLVQGDELDDELAVHVGATRAIFLERGFIIPFKLGDNEITRLGRNFRIDDDLIPSPEFRQHAVARDGAPSKKKNPRRIGI